MTFGEAHDLMDLLLDKADQPYFTVEEKDKFLNLAYFDWFDKALDRYDTDPEIAKCLGKLVNRIEGRFEVDSRIFMHTARHGAQSVPFRAPASSSDLTNHGVPVDAVRSISRYPLARILHVQVLYVNKDTGVAAKSWKEVNIAKSNEFGLYYSDTSSDPFNKADKDNVKGYMQGAHLQIFPNDNGEGESLTGWSSMDVTGYNNAGKWRARVITYPMASNVAAGDADTANIPADPSLWGTRNLQMGSFSYFQLRDNDSASATYDSIQYSNGPVGAENWGWPVHICNEIVQNAVRMMTSNIEGANYQSQAIEAEQSRSV
jgi:hypothetical protein